MPVLDRFIQSHAPGEGAPKDVHAKPPEQSVPTRSPSAADRPPGSHIQAVLGVPNQRPSPSVFVGRVPALTVLQELATRMLPAIGLVSGPSGGGKSRLVKHFLAQSQGVVLTGRCHRGESLPHQAIDGVIDALARHLASRTTPLGVLLDVPYLLRLFPDLKKVLEARPDDALPDDVPPQRVRRRALGALQRLLAVLASHQPVCIVLEDLQWGDAESARMLAGLLTGEDAPPVLVLATLRDTPVLSPFVDAWTQLLAALDAEGRVARLPLPPLGASEVRELVAALVGPHEDVFAESILKESHGSPFHITELSRRTRDERALSLPDALDQRLQVLGSEARALLSLASVTSHRVTLRTLVTAGGGSGNSIDALHSAGLIDLLHEPDDVWVEIHHHRIRDAMLALLTPLGIATHRAQLGEALVVHAPDDPERIALLFAQAKAFDRAAPFARTAGDRAWSSLAFGRAAELYALALRGLDDPTLARQCADAYAHAGRCAEAADRYEALAKAHDDPNLRRLAAEIRTQGGQEAQGVALLEQELAKTGLSWPRSGTTLGIRLALELLWLWLRGPDQLIKDISPSPESRRQGTLVWSGIQGLTTFDAQRTFWLSAVGFRLAGGAGQRRLAGLIGLSLSATLRSLQRPLGDTLRTTCVGLLDHEDAFAQAMIHSTDARAALHTARWQDAWDHGEAAHTLLDTQCPDTSHERTAVQSYMGAALQHLGLLHDQVAFTSTALRQAEEAGDRNGVISMLMQRSSSWLTLDQPDQARAVCQTARTLCETDEFGWRQLFLGAREGETDRYLGDARVAWTRAEKLGQQVKAAGYRRYPLAECLVQVGRGHAAALALVEPCEGLPEPTVLKQTIAAAAKGLRAQKHQKQAVSIAEATMLDAALAVIEGDIETARAHLDEARKHYMDLDQPLHALVCDIQLARLSDLPDDDLIVELAAAGARDPDRWLRAYTPSMPT